MEYEKERKNGGESMTPTDERIMECIRKGIDTAPEMTADHLNLPVIPIYLNAVDYDTYHAYRLLRGEYYRKLSMLEKYGKIERADDKILFSHRVVRWKIC